MSLLTIKVEPGSNITVRTGVSGQIHLFSGTADKGGTAVWHNVSLCYSAMMTVTHALFEDAEAYLEWPAAMRTVSVEQKRAESKPLPVAIAIRI